MDCTERADPEPTPDMEPDVEAAWPRVPGVPDAEPEAEAAWPRVPEVPEVPGVPPAVEAEAAWLLVPAATPEVAALLRGRRGGPPPVELSLVDILKLI